MQLACAVASLRRRWFTGAEHIDKRGAGISGTKNMNVEIQLPEKVKFIIDTIMEAGYEAYAVGGCIRDFILGREAADWDITTSASPAK